MREKDKSEKYLENYNDVFADIVNHLLFKKELIQPESLENGSTEFIYKAANDRFSEQRRDIVKYCRKENILISIIGIENQSQIDPDMPIRIMGYDYSSYQEQIKNKTNRRVPVITICLYFGEREWKKPFSLKEILDIPEEMKSFVQDYKIHVIDVPHLGKKERESLTSDFREVADFFVGKTNENYQPSDRKLKHVEAFMTLLETFTNDKRYGEAIEKIIQNNQKGEISMCTILDSYIEKGIEQGIEQGIEKGIKKGIEKGKNEEREKMILRMYQKGLNISDIEDIMEMPASEIKKLLNTLK